MKVQLDPEGFGSSAANPVHVAAAPSGETHGLAANLTLAAGGVTSWVVVTAPGTYLFDVLGAFDGSTLELQRLGPDGVTAASFSTPVTLTASGSVVVGIAALAQVRLKNTGLASITGLYASLA